METTPKKADPIIAASRIEVCMKCCKYINEHCTISGCSCAGLGIPENMFSKCPVGEW